MKTPLLNADTRVVSRACARECPRGEINPGVNPHTHGGYGHVFSSAEIAARVDPRAGIERGVERVYVQGVRVGAMSMI